MVPGWIDPQGGSHCGVLAHRVKRPADAALTQDDQQPHGGHHGKKEHPRRDHPRDGVKAQRPAGEVLEVEDQGHHHLNEGQRRDGLVDAAQTSQGHGQHQSSQQAQKGAQRHRSRRVHALLDGEDGGAISPQGSEARGGHRKGAGAKDDRLAQGVPCANENQVQQRKMGSDETHHGDQGSALRRVWWEIQACSARTGRPGEPSESQIAT